MGVKVSERKNAFGIVRIAKDLKVVQVAENLQVSSAYVHAIESGNRYPAPKVFDNYAGLFQMQPSTLMKSIEFNQALDTIPPISQYQGTLMAILEYYVNKAKIPDSSDAIEYVKTKGIWRP